MSMTREEFKKKWKDAKAQGAEAEADLIFGVVATEEEPDSEAVAHTDATDPRQIPLPLE